MKKTYILLFLIIFTHVSFATIRYVSKTGSSTPPFTSWETASDSIQKCVNVCVDGDTVLVANGVYNEVIYIYTPIYLLGTSMDSTIVDGTGLLNTTLNIYAKATVENFEIKGWGSYAPSGVVIIQGHETLVKNCLITGAFNGFGIRSKAFVSNNIMKNVIFGISSSGSGSYDSVYIINNLFLVPANPGIGISISNGRRFFIHNNVILALDRDAWFGISIDQVQSAVITNNLVSGFKSSSAYDDSAPRDSAYLANNVFGNSGQSPNIFSVFANVDIHMGTRTRALNNIVYNSYHGIMVLASLATYDYNLLYKNVVNFRGYINDGPNTVYGDPMFVKEKEPTLFSDHDFHLQMHSPGIDAGNPEILDADGTRSDIGMYGGPLGEIYEYLNLSPKVPRGLTAKIDSGYIKLKWEKNTESDFSHYKLYCGKTAGFPMDTTTLLAVLTDTSYNDTQPTEPVTLYYKLTGVDTEKNESDPTAEVKVTITDVKGEETVTTDYALYQNYPNPFNGETKIPYMLKDRGRVKIKIYDIKGELVKVVTDEEQESGYHEVNFSGSQLQGTNQGVDELASGIYLYRIEVIGEGGIPRYIDVKKMIMLK